MNMSKYETVIGLEVHVQLSTKSKIFCGCSTEFGSEPNTHVCPVCLGLPGTLPVFNREVLNRAIKVALALDCTVAKVMKFDRKNYFYPDLPKNFQISQFDLPLGAGGYVNIATRDGQKKIGVTRVHLEEDAGKLIHVEGKDLSLVDYNRTGTPLLEIVSEPDIATPDEAHRYLRALKAILKYLDISDCNMEEGSLRCDANISLRPVGQKELGVKAELKNMNSFKGIKNALEYEVERQRKLLDEGGRIVQQTRLWNESKMITISMRAKEEAYDYRYFPEPDLVPFYIEKALVGEIRSALPELPAARYDRFINGYKLQRMAASIIVQDKEMAEYFEECVKLYDKPQVAANWLTGDLLSEFNKRFSQDKSATINSLGVSPDGLAELLKLVDSGEISGKIAKQILPEMIDGKRGAGEIVKSGGLTQMRDRGEIEKVVADAMRANPKPVEDYKGGKEGALIFLIGQVMKATGGKANPKIVNQLLKERMDKV